MNARIVKLVAVIALGSVVGLPVALGGVSRPAAPTGNLIRNGGAELGRAVTNTDSVVAAIPGWTKTGISCHLAPRNEGA